MRWWKFALVALPVPLIARIAYTHLHGYQRARIETFLHPESDPLGAGYNIIQSKIALGSGGMWGKGFMHGTQAHLDFLPEKQTDFIYTIIGEEFGLVGTLAVLGLLCLIMLGAMLIALRCRHQFGRLVALGIGCNFFLYVFVNIAMVTGAIPVGGVPMPLVSHGGSALLTVMLGFGMLMSVHVHRDVEFSEARDDMIAGQPRDLAPAAAGVPANHLPRRRCDGARRLTAPPRMDALLARHGARCAVFVTAWNPFSRRMPAGWNRRMQAAPASSGCGAASVLPAQRRARPLAGGPSAGAGRRCPGWRSGRGCSGRTPWWRSGAAARLGCIWSAARAEACGCCDASDPAIPVTAVRAALPASVPRDGTDAPPPRGSPPCKRPGRGRSAERKAAASPVLTFRFPAGVPTASRALIQSVATDGAFGAGSHSPSEVRRRFTGDPYHLVADEGSPPTTCCGRL